MEDKDSAVYAAMPVAAAAYESMSPALAAVRHAVAAIASRGAARQPRRLKTIAVRRTIGQ